MQKVKLFFKKKKKEWVLNPGRSDPNVFAGTTGKSSCLWGALSTGPPEAGSGRSLSENEASRRETGAEERRREGRRQEQGEGIWAHRSPASYA